MSSNDYQKMAGVFLDIWQEQLAKSLTDGDFIRQMTNMMRSFQPAGKAGHEQENRYTAHASGAQSDELADLQQRLAACERRIKQLESWANPSKSTKTSRRDEPQRDQQPSEPRGTKAKPAEKPQPPKPHNPTRKVIKRAVKRK